MTEIVQKHIQDFYTIKEGDVIEKVMFPLSPTSRGGICTYGPRWFFRLWRATAVKIEDFPRKIHWEVEEPEVLLPDDHRVVEFLKEEFTPRQTLLK